MKKQRVVVLMKNQGGKMQLTLVLNYSCQSKTQTFEKKINMRNKTKNILKSFGQQYLKVIGKCKCLDKEFDQ